jgi:site-specific recombinase XerD
MKTSNSFGVHFYLRKNREVNGKAPIYARISVDAKRADFSVKQWIEEKNWCTKKGAAKGTREEIRSLNLFLEQLRAGFVATYQELLLQRKLITAQAIKNAFLGLEEREYTLRKIMEYHDKTMRDSLAWGTMKNYGATQRYLQSFLKSRFRTDDIFLSHITYKFIIDFEHYLRTTTGLDEKRPLSNNGVMKHMERFKKLVNLAVRMEWMEKDPFNKYQLKFVEVDRESLSEEELETVKEKEFALDRLERVRDMFVFSCYTGLAYIDLMRLRTDDINIGIDGEHWIFIRRKKSHKPVKVPLLPEAMAILKKYQNEERTKTFGTVFPLISNQKMNDYLKEMAEKCDITKNLTFHLARHTFATTVTLTNGVPIETVSKMLGHSSLRTTQIYAKVIESKISEDMTNLRARLAKKGEQGKMKLLAEQAS